MIDADRLWQRLMALARIGDSGDGGVNRQALTAGEADAWRLLIGWAEAAGLEASTDAAANLFLTRPGRDRALPPLLLGSHIDTQPTGGKFDGAFGVLASLEATLVLPLPARDVTVVAWMNEEGCRFAPGMMGSEAFSGLRDLAAIRAVRDAGGISTGEAIDAFLQQFPCLPRRPLGFSARAYLEPHIEQGPVLEQTGKVIGIVTGIQGKKTWEMVVEGDEGHAGTLDLALRRDALARFAAIAHAMHSSAAGVGGALKFTIGQVRVEPNAPSVVPGRVVFRIDLRHPENALLDEFADELEDIARQQAPPCQLGMTRMVEAPSNGFDQGLQERIAAAAQEVGVASMRMLSAAGHDARHMAPLCPSAMIFIPCRGGISHSPQEWAEPQHVAAGAEVLARVAKGLTA